MTDSQRNQLGHVSGTVIRLPWANRDEQDMALKEPRGSQPRRAQKTQTQIPVRQSREWSVLEDPGLRWGKSNTGIQRKERIVPPGDPGRLREGDDI